LTQELRVKNVQIRSQQEQIDMYQGKAAIINSFNRQQLSNLNDELEQAKVSVTVALGSKRS